ncbi:hypothetical protein [Coxiella burnetii]|uniref:Uncharacterized protein n=1 Tax=Coxiella burnetii (strain Dugway 5J108-111) TaxID=434922 RepID=A9KC85_COXBN|nr:hypothetical protein [Coxiella burnetii]ABS77715.2 hypothetical protein CBUD_0679 [Coxiella burnetii Dugway 5J108-111]ACJ18645.1 hypothetical protein CbuG_1337 [Coxiella burnetii CbuG_Q212]ACJ20742.1 hypothetical protein CbuK_1589 [Coxiella burnetii CbuK_Q154]AIT63819.1 hypothetical protein CBNA_1588 [Coxiella burnetii str. Namibia]ATN67027.1 hypothetical protein AYM17_06540 [Coxiella burnetii]
MAERFLRWVFIEEIYPKIVLMSKYSYQKRDFYHIFYMKNVIYFTIFKGIPDAYGRDF